MPLVGDAKPYGHIQSPESLAPTSSHQSQDTPPHNSKHSVPWPCRPTHVMDPTNLGNLWMLQQAHLADDDAHLLACDQTRDNYSIKVIPMLSKSLSPRYSLPYNITEENLAGNAPYASSPIPLPQTQTPQLHVLTTNHLALAAIIVVFLQTMQSNMPSNMEQLLTAPPARFQDWSYRQPYSQAVPVKSWKSCLCWTTTIIRKL